MLVHKRVGAVKVTNSLQSALASVKDGSHKNQHDPDGRLQARSMRQMPGHVIVCVVSVRRI